MSQRVRTRAAVGVLVVPVLALALTACGTQATKTTGVASITGQGTPDPKSALQAKLHQYGECVRAAGFDVADPGTRDAATPPPEALKSNAGRAKVSKCYELLPPLELPKADPATMAKQRQIAQCMRAHGVPEAQDPNEQGDLVYMPAVDFSSKRFKAADQACTGEDSNATGGPAG
jgi:hypothetical protein